MITWRQSLTWEARGRQMFMGLLRSRCYSRTDGLLLSQQVCMCDECTMLDSQPMGRPYLCPEGYSCLPLAENPGLGSESFDNIGNAMSTMLQVSNPKATLHTKLKP